MIDKHNNKMFREIQDLLVTAEFSFETTLMALGIGAVAKNSYATLAQRLRSLDQESVEAGKIGVEALEHAYNAYQEIQQVFDDACGEGLALDLRFWSTLEWLNERIFAPSALETGQATLIREILEAILRTKHLLERLETYRGMSRC